MLRLRLGMTGEQLKNWLEARSLSTADFARLYNEKTGTKLRSTYINEMISGKRDVSVNVCLFVECVEQSEKISRLEMKILELVTGEG